MSKTLPIAWQVAGLGDSRGDVGGTLFPLTQPWIPDSIELDGDRIVWHWKHPLDPMADRPIRISDMKGALAAFIGIGEDPQRVVKFARRYGVLGLCEHGKPINHNPPREDGSGGCEPAGNLLFGRFESLERWFHFVRQARTLLNIAASLHDGTVPRKEDWEVIFEDAIAANTYTPWVTEPVPSFGRLQFALASDRPKKLNPEAAIRKNWLTVAVVVNEWLREGAVRPWMTFSEDGVDLRMLVNTFGALAIQLAAGVSKLHGIATCSGCGEQYGRATASQRGRRNFCGNCRGTVAAKLRQRDYKRRKQGASYE